MSLKKFTDAYIEAALWSTNDESDESGGEPLDKHYGPADIAAETLAAMKRDCEEFFGGNEYFWSATDDQAGIDDDRAGNRFWLNRNGHGTGFWDEDDLSEENQKRLSKAAKKFGMFDLYVDDGEIHGSPLRANKKRGSKKRGSRRPKKRTSGRSR